MRPADIQDRLDAILRDRRLLDHPFYRRWSDGQLGRGELARYAEQYRHYEAQLPATLKAIADAVEPPAARELVLAAYADECGAGEQPSHLSLFGEFAAAAGATGTAATTATTRLLDTYARATAAGPVAGLAAVAAYELQAAAVAATKAQGLRQWYGFTPAATRFWDLHAELDEQHAAWTSEALAAIAGRDDEVEQWAEAAAQAWWAFLDERDTARAG
jgi:pyrroloquinoline quinone (PQQ) biosynthesis protein C